MITFNKGILNQPYFNLTYFCFGLHWGSLVGYVQRWISTEDKFTTKENLIQGDPTQLVGPSEWLNLNYKVNTKE